MIQKSSLLQYIVIEGIKGIYFENEIWEWNLCTPTGVLVYWMNERLCKRMALCACWERIMRNTKSSKSRWNEQFFVKCYKPKSMNLNCFLLLKNGQNLERGNLRPIFHINSPMQRPKPALTGWSTLLGDSTEWNMFSILGSFWCAAVGSNRSSICWKVFSSPPHATKNHRPI